LSRQQSPPTTNGRAPVFNEQQFERFLGVIGNAFTLRQEWMRRYLDPRRDVEAECGYPALEAAIDAAMYQNLYEREGIAARVVEVWPKECWQTPPLVYEDEDAKTVTDFEAAWDDLGSSLKGQASWHQDEEGSAVWEYLARADVLSRIGSYGVILLGLDDGADLSQPVKGVEERYSTPLAPKEKAAASYQPYQYSVNAREIRGRKLLYLRCFPEAMCQINRFESNPTSPRYGQPAAYNLSLNDPRGEHGGIGLSSATANVHWTRVIHVADNLSSSEIFGAPAMRPVLNRLLDLRKIYASDGEGFWQSVVQRMFFETHPQLGGDVEINRAEMKDMVEQLMTGLQRWGVLKGMSAKSLPPQLLDPTPHVNAHVEAICIQLEIPVRIFKGSERGELASGQDAKAWHQRVSRRNKGYLSSRLIAPFIDRLITIGVLPEPQLKRSKTAAKGGYSIWWPDHESQSDAEKADILTKRTNSFAIYLSGGVENLIPPLDWLTREAGYDEEEATTILESAAAAVEEKEEEQEALAEEQGLEPAPPPGFTKPGEEEEETEPALEEEER
jgi:uncharacterized protein